MHGGSPCAWQTLDSGLRSTYPGAWWPLAQHTAADLRSRLHVTHAGKLWAGHACDEIMGEGARSHVAGAVGCGALLRVNVYGAWAALPPPITR